MIKVYSQNGKIISRNGKIGTSQGCCCGSGGTPQPSGLFCEDCDVSNLITNPSLKGAYCAINDSYYLLINIIPATICFDVGIPFIGQCAAGQIHVRQSPLDPLALAWGEIDPGGLGGGGRGQASLSCVAGGLSFLASYGDGGTQLSQPYGGRNPGYFTGSPIGFLSESYSINGIINQNINTDPCDVNGLSGVGTMVYTHRRFNFGVVPGDPMGRTGYWVDRECSGTKEVQINVARQLPPCFACN